MTDINMIRTTQPAGSYLAKVGFSADKNNSSGFSVSEKFTPSSDFSREPGLIKPGIKQNSNQAEQNIKPESGGILTAINNSAAKKILMGALCGITFMAALGVVSLPNHYNTANAADRPAAVLVVNQEAKQYGISEATAQKIRDNPTLESTLRSLPKQVVERFKEYNTNQRHVMYKGLSGETSTFFFTINNREAFVKGSVMGADVFNEMGSKLDEYAGNGNISRAEADHLKAGINDLRPLTPEQRDAIATMIMWECNR
ncbi:MAG: hypothetical protein LWY06_20145 [Firmicutes bacterium]|nr:hypothetical protein [Bacillota bacterium]